MRNRKIMQMTRFAAVRGVTLIELTVVLLVLVALAGLTLPMYTNTPRYAQCVATDATMANIRDAIMGSGGMGGYRSDMGGVPRLDNNITQASANASSLNDLYNNPFYDYLIPGYTAAGYTGYSNPPFNPSFNPPSNTKFTNTKLQSHHPARLARALYVGRNDLCGTCGVIEQNNTGQLNRSLSHSEYRFSTGLRAFNFDIA